MFPPPSHLIIVLLQPPVPERACHECLRAFSRQCAKINPLKWEQLCITIYCLKQQLCKCLTCIFSCWAICSCLAISSTTLPKTSLPPAAAEAAPAHNNVVIPHKTEIAVVVGTTNGRQSNTGKASVLLTKLQHSLSAVPMNAHKLLCCPSHSGQ